MSAHGISMRIDCNHVMFLVLFDLINIGMTGLTSSERRGMIIFNKIFLWILASLLHILQRRFLEDMHVAHLILCHPALSVGIVSGIFRSSSRDAIIHSAQVLPPTLTSNEAIALVPARAQCVHRVCSSRLGHHPLSEDRPHPTSMYTSLLVEVHPEPDDEDDYSSFMAAGTHTR